MSEQTHQINLQKNLTVKNQKKSKKTRKKYEKIKTNQKKLKKITKNLEIVKNLKNRHPKAFNPTVKGLFWHICPNFSVNFSYQIGYIYFLTLS